ncbi:LuxR C-terminal-related transcriptional regulator [Spirillospora sp. NPDC049652]
MTDREHDVLRLIAAGHTNTEIADGTLPLTRQAFHQHPKMARRRTPAGL